MWNSTALKTLIRNYLTALSVSSKTKEKYVWQGEERMVGGLMERGGKDRSGEDREGGKREWRVLMRTYLILGKYKIRTISNGF